MLLKTVAVAAMIFIGVAARQFVTERLTRVEVMSAPTANRLRRAFGFEAIVGVVVLVLSSWLLALTPAHAASGSSTANKDLGVPQLIRNTDNGVEVQVRFTQVVGPNAVRVDVLQAPDGFTGLQVICDAAGRLRRRRRVARRAAHLRVRRASCRVVGHPHGAAGTWTITVKINGADDGFEERRWWISGTPTASTVASAPG